LIVFIGHAALQMAIKISLNEYHQTGGTSENRHAKSGTGVCTTRVTRFGRLYKFRSFGTGLKEPG
jgi:hypothetical protein